jgi:hypothetical protein
MHLTKQINNHYVKKWKTNPHQQTKMRLKKLGGKSRSRY